LKKLVIFGVGLIGGSAALALKSKHPALHIVGVGRTPAQLQVALDLGVIDEASTDIAIALQGADIALIAAPVAQTPNILKSIKPHLESQTVITDAGSTKTDVITSARQILGEKFNQFIGGHPIAGAEKSGAAAAMIDLYQGKNVVLTPSDETPTWVQDKVTALWEDCGAKLNVMSAAQHDEIFASVSHLPHLLAFALVEDIANRDNAEQLFTFAASGFRDFSRIAGSHPEMWRDISLANKPAILKSLDSYLATLTNIKNLLENEDGDGIQATFDHASKARNEWAHSKK
jgi:prephenate dehydrogenase